MDEISFAKKLTVHFFMCLIKVLIFIYDTISQPIYYVKHKVYKKQHELDRVERSKQIKPFEPESPWVQINIEPFQAKVEARIDSHETYEHLMENSFQRYNQKPCYGYRQVLHEQWTKRPDSDKLLRQVKLSDYKWITYGQFNMQIEAARNGLLIQGIRAGDKVMLYADTRPEWQIASQAVIRLGAIVVTMYSTLGVDGIVHSMNETEVTHVITQKDKVSKLLKLKPKLPVMKKIIYFEPLLQLPIELGGDLEKASFNGQADREKDFEHSDQVMCCRFSRVLADGLDQSKSAELAQLEAESKANAPKRHKDSIAVIMYTSGSTGVPKGVLISHRNIMATIKSFYYVTKDFILKPDENLFAAYLPLAHIFEFCIESLLLCAGHKCGYASPQTLTEKSPGLMPGEKGDINLLKPTVMIIVPLVLDRVVQGIKSNLKSQSYFKHQLITYLINYKSFWQGKHYETPLVDTIVCKKVAQALGGRIKYLICGSAPLSAETQAFIRAALNLKLAQGFGTTETCAATAVQLCDDQSTGNVGLPVAGAQIKLEPWLEGNYRPTDKPHPRGEIVVGGEMIAHGYFKLEEQTKEAFYEDEAGTRWYRTGDIGEFLPNGCLKVIDRKKDLVKLQNGEYVSLGKIESSLKSNPFTENFCVYVNSSYNYVVALGPANEASIKSLAQRILDDYQRNSPTAQAKNDELKALVVSNQSREDAITELKEILDQYKSDELNNNQETDRNIVGRKMSALSNSSNSPASCINEQLQKLCDNRLILERVLSTLKEMALQSNLLTLEVPKKILLLAEEWTEDKNLVTAAMKIRRNFIYKRYERELEKLYNH